MGWTIQDLPASPSGSDTLRAIPMQRAFDSLHAGLALHGVVEGCVAVEDPVTPAMTFDISAGKIRSGGKPIAVSAQTDIVVTAAHGTLDRIDLASINTSGTVIVTAGTAETEPVLPAIPTDNVAIREIIVRATVTQLFDEDLQDIRAIVPDNHGTFNVMWYGAVGDGSTNDATAISSTIIAAEAASPDGTVYFPALIFKINSGLTFTNCSIFAEQGAQLLVDDAVTGTAVQIGAAATYMWNQKLVMPEVVRDNQLWSVTTNVATVLSDIGIEFVAMRECEIYLQRISLFSYGFDLAGDTKGISYNNFYVGWLENNAVSQAFRPVNAGWSNENKFYGGRWELQQNGASTRITNTKLIQLGQNLAGFKPDNNIFFGPSLEGSWDEFALECWGAYNMLFGARWEGSGKAVVWKAFDGSNFANNNEIHGGYEANSLTITEDANARYNNVYSPQKSYIEGSDATAPWRYMNRFSDSKGMAFYPNNESLYAHADSEWQMMIAANQTYWKGQADTWARIYVWGTLGRLYFGTGAADASMYFQAVSASVLGFNGGDIDMQTGDIVGIGNMQAETAMDIKDDTGAIRYRLSTNAVGDWNLLDKNGVSVELWDESDGLVRFNKQVVANKPTRYTAGATLTQADRAVICDHATAQTFTLPALSTITDFPHMVVISAFGAGATTVDPGTDNLDGATTDKVLTGGETPPASLALVVWDTTDDWVTWSEQGTVT